MTTGLTYATYKTQIATLAVVSETDANFLTILPSMIDYAELRICRDVDFLSASVSNSSYALTANDRRLTIPAGTFVVSEQLNIITPAGTTNPEAGMRVPLLPATKEFLDAVYGSAASAGAPKYFAPFNDEVFIVGPFPDANYQVEIVGMVRPETLSLTNTTTFISSYLPDLFVMASMIYISGYQRNFGKISDDPQMAVTYESQYQTLLKGAIVEEARKKYEASAWSSQGPSPVATPTR
jgi:hypothetical protein